MKLDTFIDNKRPDDETYPNFEPGPTAYNPDGSVIYVKEGGYVIDRDGDFLIATTGNDEWKDKEGAMSDINRGFFRAKYIGNKDDHLEFANQCRLASYEEIKVALKWEPASGIKVHNNGQLSFI